MVLKSKGKFLLSSALLGALAPLIIWGLSHFVPDPYKNYCGPEVAASNCAENVLAERSADRFDLVTLPFWPTGPIIAFIGFVMMEEGRDGDWPVQVSVTTLAMLLNAASYVFVGLLFWKLKDLWKVSRQPLVQARRL
jgi:hypothetical protein